MQKVTLKKVISSDNWIITRVHNWGKNIRIDAKTRFHIPDGQNFFSESGSFDYVNKLYKEFKGMPIIKSKHW
jgi:hypothetical protein